MNNNNAVNDDTGPVGATGPVNAAGATGPNVNSNKDLPGRRTYNPLSKLASYVYNLSLYQVTPDAYEAFILSGRRNIDILKSAQPLNEVSSQRAEKLGAYLIAQSGGINNKTQSRAPGFELDYYIENFEVKVATSQKELQTSAFVGTGKMTIVEPYGFSFLANLKRCLSSLQEYSKATGFQDSTNALRQFFVLGIRFYGYDINGNLIKGTDTINGEALDPENGTEALFETFYDLSLVSLRFQLTGKGTTYNLEFASPGAMTMLGTKRGRITTGARVVGSTVKEMLNGPDGLLTKLNNEQIAQTNTNPKTREIPNKFLVEFAPGAEELIANASMVLQSDIDKIKFPGSAAKNATEVTDSTGLKEKPNFNAREMSFTNDTGIIQAITQIIQRSTFMTNALNTVLTNTLQPNNKNVQQLPNNSPQKLSWFTVSAKISDIAWDSKTNDWAYTTTFIITPYEIVSISTPYVSNLSKYYGPHKYYEYYLTGKNTEVIDFSLTFNTGYFNTVISNIPGTAPIAEKPGSNAGQTSTAPGVLSGGDKTAVSNLGNEAQAGVITALNDPSAYATGKIVILGDPDFLVKDQVTNISQLYEKFYDTSRFTASAHGGQVFIEVILKEAVDYVHSMGLKEINDSIQFYPYPKHVQDIAKGIVYQVNMVNAAFAQGKFTMTLELNGAASWAKDESNQQAREITGSSGANAPGNNNNSTDNNQGSKADPQVNPPKTTSPVGTQAVNNTVGNPSPQTKRGVAADDSQPSPAPSPAGRTDEGRETVPSAPSGARGPSARLRPPSG